MKFLTSLVFLAIFSYGSGAKILGIFPLPVHSHHTLGFTLMKELADKGHEVTFINPFPQKEKIKNLKEVSSASLIEKMEELRKKMVNLGQISVLRLFFNVYQIEESLSRALLTDKNIQELLHSNETFDLILLENVSVYPMAIFAHIFKGPLVQLAPIPLSPFSTHIVANPYPISYLPYVNSDLAHPMTFWERIKNSYYTFLAYIYIHLFSMPAANKLLKEYVPDAPELIDIFHNTSLLLIISHPSIGDPVPLQANVKEIGGYHIAKPKPLPKDIQEFMDNATEGVILFSMGSNLKSSNLPKEKIDAVLASFGKLKEKVLWKFETDDLPGKPDNVKILKWLPQSDLLAHPNIKVFIGHGGLLSTTEAVYHGVPMIGLPVFWDQMQNIKTAASKGYAVYLPFEQLNEEAFTWALNEVLHDPKYRTEMKMRSKIMHSDPMSQMDSAVFWLEYVIKTNGARHLRSAGMDLNWWQINLIDVIAVLTIAGILIIALNYYIVAYIVRLIRKSFKSNKQKLL